MTDTHTNSSILELLIDPYKEVELEDLRRLNIDVSAADKMLIQSVCPIRGVIQNFVAMYVKSIANELRTRNITSYSPENHAEFVRIVLRHADNSIIGSPSSQHEPGGTQGVHPANTNAGNKPADVQGTASLGVGRKKTVKKAG